MKNRVDFEYSIGAAVVHGDSVKSPTMRVDTRGEDRSGQIYVCSWWHEGEFKTRWFRAEELVPAE